MATSIVTTNLGADNKNTDVSKRFVTLINNNPYRFNIGLVTSDGRYQELRVGAINNLVIEDTFTNFYESGYIILNNTFDALERVNDLSNTNNLQTSTNSSSVKGYLMRGDARDLLIVDIMPDLTEGENNYGNVKDSNANKAFKMSHIFAIYNTEEILGNSPGQKFKKMYFWDIHYELLREKNSYFSTANSVASATQGFISTFDDKQRSIFTGDALKAFLLDFFNDDDGWPIKIGNTFEQGSTKIFFSAPAKFKGIDCLHYLIDVHASSVKNNYDKAFLRIDRNDSTFNFESLNDIFKKAVGTDANSSAVLGANYIETFKLGAYPQIKDSSYNLESVSFTPLNALFMDKYGTINNFTFDPMPGEFTQEYVTSVLVHSYDPDEKQFQIDQERNSMAASLSVYKLNYVDSFKNAGQNIGNVYENIFPGEYRLKNKNVKNVFTIIGDDADQRLTQGRNKVLFNSVFFNNTVNFRVPGASLRQAGQFIGITFDGAGISSEFNKKLLGVYFVIDVKHIFTGNEYFNELKCVKTYNLDNLLLNPDSK